MIAKAQAPYPYMGINGEYFDRAFLEGVEAELIRKVPIWAPGSTSQRHVSGSPIMS